MVDTPYVITFTNFASAGNREQSSYSEQNFIFNSPRTGLVYVSPDDPQGNTGSSALRDDEGGDTFTLSRQDGEAFSIKTFDADGFVGTADHHAVDFTVSAVTAAGFSVSESFETDAALGPQTFTLDSDFDNIKSFQYTLINGQPVSVVFDNIATDTPVPCFASGTLIGTERGETAVENLVIGDLVMTTSGAARPVRWLGHRTINCRRHGRKHEVYPVCIAAHAFGTGRPARNLLVSPGHAICVDVCGEVLIPALALVDGGSITQIAVDTITYWHVELDSHDVLFAEKLPAESFLDMGNRGFFVEADVVGSGLVPDADNASRTHADFCRPFFGSGPVVEAVRARLGQSRPAYIEGGEPRAAMG